MEETKNITNKEVKLVKTLGIGFAGLAALSVGAAIYLAARKPNVVVAPVQQVEAPKPDLVLSNVDICVLQGGVLTRIKDEQWEDLKKAFPSNIRTNETLSLFNTKNNDPSKLPPHAADQQKAALNSTEPKK